VDPDQEPRQSAVRRHRIPRAHHDGGTARASMSAGVGKEVSVTLKARPNGDATTACRTTGRWCSVSWNPEREPHDQQRSPQLDLPRGRPDVLEKRHAKSSSRAVPSGRFR
jgi:hypothetical protein